MHSFSNLVLLALASTQAAHAAINLGAAKSFGTLAGLQLANTGTTSVIGDIGTWPGTTITGYGPGAGTYSGSINPGNAVAQTAQKYCLAAYKSSLLLTPTGSLPADLSGLTLPPGVYKFPVGTPNVFINTVLTLTGAPNPNGQWIFLVPASFYTATGAAVNVVGGGQTCNVYFIVQQSASIGDSTRFQGNILAYDTIKVGKEASNTRGTFCTTKGPIVTIYNKLTAYLPACLN